jgi:hypothetical protein
MTYLDRDAGYSIEYCQSAKSAAETLSTTSGERAYWERIIRCWDTQLKHARKRVATRPNHPA